MSIYQAVFWGFVAFVALVLAYGLVQDARRAHRPKPQPAQPAPVVPEVERCVVENPDRCPEPFALERHGWRLCKGHARDMLGGAA